MEIDVDFAVRATGKVLSIACAVRDRCGGVSNSDGWFSC